MIRINLLAVERERSKRRAVVPAAYRVAIGATLIILATLAGLAWWYWSLQQQSAAVDAAMAEAERETQKLRGVLAQVQQFESRKAQLQQRVTLIEELRRGQGGPVRAIDEISKAIPDRLWLTEIAQKGEDFMISGMTTSLTGLSDFVASLEGSGWFRRPVDIIDSQVERAEAEVFKFSVRASFNNPELPPPPAAPAAAGARGRGAAR